MTYKIVGQGSKWTVIQGDILDYLAGSLWLRQYDNTYFHLVFSDWPYHLDSIVKRFSGPNSVPARHQNDGSFQRQSRGFMNWKGDSTDIAYQPETWEAIKSHLYPGAFTASFSHPRKQHRLAMAQELAGYVMNPALYQLGWIYSSGKPNGTNIGLLLDRRAGAEREVIGKHPHPAANRPGGNSYNLSVKGMPQDVFITTPTTPLAQTWAGHQYGSPLAPELEPIIIAQAPRDGDRLDTVTTTGAGAVNIEAGKNGMPGHGHPGHFIITHHPGCVYRGEKMIKNNGGDTTGNEPSRAMGKNGIYGKMEKRTAYQAKGDENGMLAIPDYDCHPDCIAARLNSQNGSEKSYHFYQADWQLEITERLAEINPVFYNGKVQATERNAGCEAVPLAERRRVNPGGYEHEARFAPTQQHNTHPTLKPIKMCKWIAGLFLPPQEYSPLRMIDCTCGTGSLLIGGLLAGWDEVIGVELDPKFADIACRRLEWWSNWLEWGQTDVDKILATKEQSDIQLSLFED